MAEDIKVNLGFNGDAKGFVTAASQGEQATIKLKASTANLNTELLKTSKITGDIAKSSTLNAGAMVADQKKILDATSITSAKLAQQEILLNSLYGAGSSVMEKRYLNSIQGLSFALQRANKEFANTIVIHKGVASAMDEAGNGMDRFRIKADLSVRTLENMNTRLTNVGKNMQWTGRQLMVGVTSGIAGVGAIAIKSFMDIETAAKQTRAMVGDQAMPALEKSAKQLAATWGTSTTDMITSLGEFQKSLNTTPEMTKKLGDLAASFDQIGNINNMQKSTDFVKNLYNSTKDINETTKAIQMLGAVGQSTNIDLSNMADVMPKAIPLFKEFNISLATGVSYLAAFKENSVDPAAGLQGLKILLGNLNSATSGGLSNVKTIKKEIESLNDAAGKGITFTNGQGQYDGATAIQSMAKAYGQLNDQQRQAMAINLTSTVAGRRQFTNILPLLNSVANAYGYINTTADGATTKVGDFQKAQEIAAMSASDLAKNWEGLGKQFQKDPTTVFKALKEQVKQAAADIGGTLMPYVVQVVGWIKKGLDWFNGLGAGTKKWIADLAIGAALIGPIVYAVGQMVVLASTLSKIGLVKPLTAMFKLHSRPMERMLGEGKGKLYGGDTTLQNYFKNVSENPEINTDKKIKVHNTISDYVKAGDRSDVAKEALMRKLDDILIVENKDKSETEKHTKAVKDDTKALDDDAKAKLRLQKTARLAEQSKPILATGDLRSSNLMAQTGMTSKDASLVIAELQRQGFLTKDVNGKTVLAGQGTSVDKAKVKVTNDNADPVPVRVIEIDPKSSKVAEAQAQAVGRPANVPSAGNPPIPDPAGTGRMGYLHNGVFVPLAGNPPLPRPAIPSTGNPPIPGTNGGHYTADGRWVPGAGNAPIPNTNAKARKTGEDSEVVPVGGRSNPTSETIVAPVRKAIKEGIAGVRSSRNPLGEIGAAQLAGAVTRGLDEHAKQRGGHAGLVTETIKKETAGAWNQVAGVVQRNFKNTAAENQLNDYIKYLRNDQNMRPNVAAYGSPTSAFDKNGNPRKKVVTGYQNVSESVNSLFDLDANGVAHPRYQTRSSTDVDRATKSTPLTEVTLKQWIADMQSTHKSMGGVIKNLQTYDDLSVDDQKILKDLTEARKELAAEIRRTKAAVLTARSSAGESMGLPEPSFGGQASSSSLNTELKKKGLSFSRVVNGKLYQSSAVKTATPDLMQAMGFGEAKSGQLPVNIMKSAADQSIADVDFIKNNLPKQFIDVIMGRAVGGMSQGEVEAYLRAHLKEQHWDLYGEQLAQRINSVAEQVAIKEGFSNSQLNTFTEARPTQNVQNTRDLELEAQRRAEVEARNAERPQHVLTEEIIPEQQTWITDPNTGQRQKLSGEDAASIAQKRRADEESRIKKAQEDRAKAEDEINKQSGMTLEERNAQFTPEAMAAKRNLRTKAGMLGHQIRNQVVRTNQPRVAPGPMPDENNPEAGFFRPWAFLDRFSKQANTEIPKIEKNGDSIFTNFKNLFVHIKAGSDAADKAILAGNKHVDGTAIGSKLKSGASKLFGLGQGEIKNSGGGDQGVKSGLMGGAIQAIMPGGSGMGMMMTGMLPQTLAMTGMTALMGLFAAHWNDIQKGITNGLSNLQTAASKLMDAIIKPIKSIFDLGKGSKSGFEDKADTWKSIGQMLNGVFNGLADIIKFLTPIIGGLVTALAELVRWGGYLFTAIVQATDALGKLGPIAKVIEGIFAAWAVLRFTGLIGSIESIGKTAQKAIGVAQDLLGKMTMLSGLSMAGITAGLVLAAAAAKQWADAVARGRSDAAAIADGAFKSTSGDNTVKDLAQQYTDVSAQYDGMLAKYNALKKSGSGLGGFTIGGHDDRLQARQMEAELSGLKTTMDGLTSSYKNEEFNLLVLGKQYNMTTEQLQAFAKAHNIQLTDDPKGVGEKFGTAMREGIAAKLDDNGNPIPAPGIGDPSQSISDFVSQFQTEMKKQTSQWKKEAMDAFDDQSKKKIAGFDDQIKALDAQQKAEDDAAKADQRRLAQQELDEQIASDRNAYITDRQTALYEGKYDVAKQLDLKYMETQDKNRDAQVKLTDQNAKDDAKTARDNAKAALDQQKTDAQAQLDVQKEALQTALDNLDNFVPHSQAEAEKLRQNMFKALSDAGVDISAISNKQGALFTQGWSDAMKNTQAALVDKDFWASLVTDTSKFAAFAGDAIAKSFSDAIASDPNAPTPTPDAGAGNGSSPGGPNGNGTSGVDGIQVDPNSGRLGVPGGTGSSVLGPTATQLYGGLLSSTRHHTGGPIGSNGSPQDVPATLQTGEYVIQRKAASALGKDNLDALNNAHNENYFHTGGLVGATTSGIKNQWIRTINAFKAGKAKIAGKTIDQDKQEYLSKFGGLADLTGYDVTSLTQAAIDPAHLMSTMGGLKQGAIQLLELIMKHFPGIYFTSGFRPGGSSYHAMGQAVDVDFGGDHSADLAVENYLAPLASRGILAELIHTPGTNNFKDGRQGTSLELYGPDVAQQHINHVHAAVANAFADGLKNIGLPIGGNNAAVSGDTQSYVKSLMPQFGWGDDQWGALNSVVTRESSWNPNAANPSSTARGLFQFLDTTWQEYITSRGGPPYWTNDVGVQAKAGLAYIKERYGTPGAAWQHEIDQGWYHGGGPVSLDVGGLIQSDGIAKVHTGEAVVTKAMMQNGISGHTVNMELHFDGGFFGTDRELEKLVDTIETKLVPRLNRAQGNELRHFRSYR